MATALSPGAPPNAVSQSGGSARTPITKTAAPKKTAGAKPPPTLAQQASQLANQTVAAQVAAIQAQQQAALQQAQEQAHQIALASQGAARYEQGLGTATYGNYKDAASTLAGLAGGFSGQLGQDSQAQFGKDASDLAAVGGNPGQIHNSAPDLANALYGMLGLQPASALLQGGTAAAARENAIPQGLLGYGQDLAAGALGAGAKSAQALVANILQARSQLPTLTGQYASQLQTQQDNATKLAISEALAQATIGGKQTSATLAGQKFAAQQDQFIKSYNLKVDALNARTGAAGVKAAAPNAALSKTVGFLVNASGQLIRKPNGSLNILPGFKVQNGSIVKVSTAKTGKAAKTGDKALFPNLSTSQAARLRSEIIAARKGVLKGAIDPMTGKPAPDTKPPLLYFDAINEMVGAGWTRAYATAMANKFYSWGKNGRPNKPGTYTGSGSLLPPLRP